ncbi:Epididymal secretory protein E1, partial [Cyphomyrmex costatus]
VAACIVLAFCIGESLQDTPHERCENGPMPDSLTVDGCNGSPCDIHRGTNLTAHWDFKAIADAEKLITRVKVTIMGATVPYPYPYPNACESLTNSKCPLKKGDKVTYNLFMPISKLYPPASMTIEFALVDEKSNVQVCFKLNAQVANS